MDALAGPYLAAALLLVLAGAQKAHDPKPLVRALASVGLPVPRSVVRTGAVAETALGALALLTAATDLLPAAHALAATGLALSYAAFTAFVLLALARGGVLASCGCFGKADTPPTVTHAAVTGALAVAAGLVATGPLAAVTLPLLVTSAAVAATAYLVLAVLPLVQAR